MLYSLCCILHLLTDTRGSMEDITSKGSAEIGLPSTTGDTTATVESNSGGTQ